MRVVDLPVSATEDRVVGTLDLEEAIQHGKKKFDPGILADANRGILYVDEVNLLDDHIVDLLLDSAAMGVNTVEREGVSYSHPARFILVGTMNPEEGELRPQLLDRFGMSVRIAGIQEPEKRIQIIKYRNAYDENPEAFCKQFEEADREVASQLVEAREKLYSVQVSDELLLKIAKISVALGIDGHRGDLTLMKAVRAHAALGNRSEATDEDILAVAHMVFLHRMRSLPFEQTKTFDPAVIEHILQEETA
jgi:Mg-chelatase subunit ChlI